MELSQTVMYVALGAILVVIAIAIAIVLYVKKHG